MIDAPKIDQRYFGGGGGGASSPNEETNAQKKRDRAIAEIAKLKKQRDRARRALAKAKRARARKKKPTDEITGAGLALPVIIGGAILAIWILAGNQKR